MIGILRNTTTIFSSIRHNRTRLEAFKAFRKFTVAIDGPAASGKSTVASMLASRLGFMYLDSGSIYRCATLLAIQNNMKDFEEAKTVEKLVEKILGTKIDMVTEKGDGEGLRRTRVFMDGVDVSSELRGNEINKLVSLVAKFGEVRDAVFVKQRELSKGSEVGGLVMDGRDIGTRVFPDAEVKIFMEAKATCRALRRYNEMTTKGMDVDKTTNKQITFDQILDEIIRRDHQDQTRKHSPLKKASDAIPIDTSDMSIQQVVTTIEQIVKSKLKSL
ncbi:hypothetical protein BB559_001701 [Furculomyces boomerangus]|uniref:(d)CMP kinase n=1 Tax=Furculomyces boomerangus TaxID=61424 RepID=A0A2T9Z106_9FUNG|nr:hypothetical protein BB559_001701 [Furculomyces boomerangus]